MRTVALAAALVFACVSASAEARPRHAPVQCVETGTVLHPVCGAAGDHRSAGHGARFIRGRLVCALNVDAELARRGIRGTGSARAKSYLSWGRASRPVPGAVAVFNRGRRGGHVAIVHHVRPDGTVIYLNPSSRRQAWQVGPYRKQPIAYRVAGF